MSISADAHHLFYCTPFVDQVCKNWLPNHHPSASQHGFAETNHIFENGRLLRFVLVITWMLQSLAVADMDKIFVSANDLLVDTFHLALSIEEADFKPDVILGIWRGGATVAMTIQEYFSYRGQDAEHLSIRLDKVGTNGSSRIIADSDGLDFLCTKIGKATNLLIVEDIFATGKTIQAISDGLYERLGEDAPENMRLAAPWYKPVAAESDREPDFYLRTTEKWVVFPHELTGLTESEIKIGKKDFATLVEPITI